MTQCKRAAALIAGVLTVFAGCFNPASNGVPPASVENLQGVPGLGSATLSWDSPDTAGVAEIQISWTPDDATTTVPASVQSTEITGLRTDTEYTFTVVTANSSGGESPERSTTVFVGGLSAAEQLYSSDPGPNDLFGWDVGVSASALVSGAPQFEGGTGTDRGHISFARAQVDGGWSEEHFETGDADNDQFGYSVDVDGDYAVAGAPRPGQSDGIEYVKIFERQINGTWTQIEKPIDGNTSTMDDFGRSVAISGLRVLAGAPLADVDPGTGEIQDAGAAHVIDENGITDVAWPEQPTVTLTASDAEANAWFGYAVALDGDRAVIGAPGAGGVNNAAYVMERQPDGSWDEAAKLTPENPQPSGGFGWSVAVDGNRIVVGAPFEDSAFGAAYVFERQDNGTWMETERLVSSNRINDASFGISVAVNGLYVAVGEEFGLAGSIYSGQVYLYAPTVDGSWSEIGTVVQTDAVGGDRWGRALAMDDGRLVVGGPERDQTHVDQGEVRGYSW